MTEVPRYLGIELPDGSLRIEGPLNNLAAQKKMEHYFEDEHFPVISTLADTEGEAIINIFNFILNRQNNQLSESAG